MQADEYQVKAAQTALYEEGANKAVYSLSSEEAVNLLNLHYVVLKLNGEAGEVAELVGKMVRDDGGKLSVERRNSILKELGDVLWYCAALCTELEADLSAVMDTNVRKLLQRQGEGKLHGSGSDR